MALLDMAIKVDPHIPVFCVDTAFLFPQTYALIEEASRHYGIEILIFRPPVSVQQQAVQYGEALWKRDPDCCCTLRKVVPHTQALQSFDAWISGLRRDQSQTRQATPVYSRDVRYGLDKICPLVKWTEADVWAYIRQHNVPYNALHDEGYRSIGCIHCTRPVAPHEDARAGRWVGFDKSECGLHSTDMHPVTSRGEK